MFSSRVLPTDRSMILCCLLFLATWIPPLSTGVAVAQEVASDSSSTTASQDFNRDIRPILSDKCYFCHGPDSGHRKADLRLDTAEGAREEHAGTRAIVPGKPDESELFRRITSMEESEQMPPRESGKELNPDEIAKLKKWIEEGAIYQPHWSYLPARRTELPSIKRRSWALNPIDRFILGRLEAEGLNPAADSDPVTLIRRVTMDLTGLLPTSEQVSDFVNDTSTNAFEKVVDRLIDSPQFGERMAMYWLDLVRYADTVGYHGDQEHPITPYRDYVIASFNENMPFDQFTREQIAGDLLPHAGQRQKIASGYNRLLQTSHEGGVQVKEYLHKYDADRVRNLSSVWLGATVGCAECHNHKYDPYTQKSFYQFAAFFADVDDLRTFKGGDSNPTRREPEMIVFDPVDEQMIQAAEKELKELQQVSATDEVGQTAVKQRLEEMRRRGRRTMVTEAITPKVVRILSRGDWMDETGEIVNPGVPDFLPQLVAAPDRRLNRVDLANWLTSADNPLTARVFVNRLWSLYFGVGLTQSLDDLGAQGELPTHPELLDWLAVEFVESAWNIKQITRSIVTSRTYRQASNSTPELNLRDPENRLFARQSQFRLPAEMIRDHALQVSGLLVQRMGGSSRPYQPVGYYKFLNFPKREYRSDSDDNQFRRGVYLHWQRQYLHPMLKAFDASTREECSVRRPISNTPLAALTLLNDPTFLEAAKMLAIRMIDHAGEATTAGLSWGWKEALHREPNPEEMAVLQSLLEFSRQNYLEDPNAAAALLEIGLSKVPERIPKQELAAWTQVTRALLNLHEMITRN